jgi:hypothetical protein
MRKKQKRGKRIFILSLWKMRKREFWIECITLYLSILIATMFVQAAILQVDTEILVFCLIKSLITTIANVLIIMLGRQVRFVQQHWFVETILYTIASIPYIEISTIYVYTNDIALLMGMIQWYAIAYFVMGLGIKKYLRWSKALFMNAKK